MQEGRDPASLSSNLLARKGRAEPAMRRHREHEHAQSSDDLGWNDWGERAGEGLAEVPFDTGHETADTPPAPPRAMPEVLRQIEQLARRINGGGKRAAAVAAEGRRAAFTLRLDAERHLRLRLASALLGTSAQDIVIEALDAYLSNLPENPVAGPTGRQR